MSLLNSIQDRYDSSDPGDRLVGVAGKAGVEVTAGTMVGATVAGGLALVDVSVREIAVFWSPSVNVTVIGGVILLFVRWFECEVIRDGSGETDREGDEPTERDGNEGERGAEPSERPAG